ncbi:MAG: type II secretion system protein GspM [Tepidimonas taiwanensis]|nr:type II secretion system protein GspM [Tepidimonas taiwanensis]
MMPSRTTPRTTPPGHAKRAALGARALRAAWVLPWLAALIVPAGLLAGYVYQKHRQLTAALQDLAPRYARVLGMQEQAATLSDLAQSAQAALQQRLYVAATDPGVVANAALQRARTALEEAGLSIEASQAAPVQDDGALQRIGLNFTVEGDAAAIAAALQTLQSSRPAIRVLKFAIRPAGPTPPSSNPRLKLQLSLAVWRQKAP